MNTTWDVRQRRRWTEEPLASAGVFGGAQSLGRASRLNVVGTIMVWHRVAVLHTQSFPLSFLV